MQNVIMCRFRSERFSWLFKWEEEIALWTIYNYRIAPARQGCFLLKFSPQTLRGFFAPFSFNRRFCRSTRVLSIRRS
jgi:hypothetical protein